jgi:predicted CXXCH cytochrome family protein
MRWPAAVLIGLTLAVVLATAAEQANIEPTPEPGYANHESCRPCHTDLYDCWAASAHARSTEVASPDNLPKEMLEEGVGEHPPLQSRFRKEGDRFFVTTTGPDGEDHEYPLTHIVGPHRMSFFLTRLPDDKLQVLPGMHDKTTGDWFDYTHLIFGVPGLPYETPPMVRPGEPSFWTGPVRSYDRTCGRCHTSGRRAEVAREDGQGTREMWHPLEVDCEACHGPCAEHVEYWKNPPDRLQRDPLVVLTELTRERAQAVCLWCHMEAEVVDPNWKPGDDVFEFLTPTLLDNIERIDAAGRPLELIYDGLPFLFSACAEEGGLTCMSCHDSHGSGKTADLTVPPERTFTLCIGCHQDIAADAKAHTHHDMTGTGGRCVACHMPFLTIERGHGHVRDHTIGSPLPDLYGGRVAKDACTWCHTRSRGAPQDAPLIEQAELLAAYREWYPGAKLRPSWVKAMAGGRDMLPEAFYDLVQVAGNEDYPKAVRASAAKLLGGYPEKALPYLMNLLDDDDSLVRRSAAASLRNIHQPDADRALLMALEDKSFAVRGEAARAALAGWTRVQENPELLKAVIPVLKAEAKAVPREDTRWFRLGAACQIAGDVDGAIEAYERKVALDPTALLVQKALLELKEARAEEDGR